MAQKTLHSKVPQRFIKLTHVELWSGKLAGELMQNFRQISLIGLRGCFPVAYRVIKVNPSDLPEFFVLITTTGN